jgi:predicted dienelactone hydrolase
MSTAIARSVLIALACVVSMLSVTTHAEERRLQREHVDAFVWTPDTDAAARWPIVVFSHGLFQCANQSRFITEAIAAAGYLVIAPNHADAICSFNREARDEPSSKQAPGATANGADYGDGARDARDALDALAADADLGPRADLSRVVLAGHSLGGYTVLSMAAALPAWKLSAVKAIVAFAPYTLPLAARGALHDLDAPVMYQVGSLDPFFTFPVSGFSGAYARSSAPKYYVEIAGAAHFAWTDGTGQRNHAIVDYAIAFLDCYVKGAPESPLLQTRQPGVTSLQRDVGRV